MAPQEALEPRHICPQQLAWPEPARRQGQPPVPVGKQGEVSPAGTWSRDFFKPTWPFLANGLGWGGQNVSAKARERGPELIPVLAHPQPPQPQRRRVFSTKGQHGACACVLKKRLEGKSSTKSPRGVPEGDSLPHLCRRQRSLWEGPASCSARLMSRLSSLGEPIQLGFSHSFLPNGSAGGWWGR